MDRALPFLQKRASTIFCSTNAQCPLTQNCFLHTTGSCQPAKPYGSACNYTEECVTTYNCLSTNVCGTPATTGGACSSNADCYANSTCTSANTCQVMGSSTGLSSALITLLAVTLTCFLCCVCCIAKGYHWRAKRGKKMEEKLKQMQKEAAALKMEYKDLIEEHHMDQKKRKDALVASQKQVDKRKTWSRHFWRRATIDETTDSQSASSTSLSDKPRRPKSTPIKTVRAVPDNDAIDTSQAPHIIRNPAMLALMKLHDIQKPRQI